MTPRQRSVQSPFEARFHAALKLAGMNVATWAKKNGVSQGYAYGVLSGDRESPPLMEKMRRFADKYVPAAA